MSGPNGFPYLDTERTQIGQWENGEFRMRVAREDGELMNINLRPKQFDALAEAVRDIEDRSVESDGDRDSKWCSECGQPTVAHPIRESDDGITCSETAEPRTEEQ